MFGEEFTASNGLRVRHNPKTGYFEYFKGFSEGWTQVAPLGETAPSMVALGEFFQAKRDKELGRWRWPENPELVVYERVKAEVVGVLHEPTGQLLPIKRGEFPEDTTGCSGAANAYFAAHPEPKTWHDAKPGEVWVVKFSAGETKLQYDGEHWNDSHGYAFDVYYTTGAYRIWPEAE